MNLLPMHLETVTASPRLEFKMLDLSPSQAMHQGLGVTNWLQFGSNVHWIKMSQLVDHVENTLHQGGTCEDLLAIVENFACGPGRWLKIAGGKKAEILEFALNARHWGPAEIAVECGTFIGYSAIRFARSVHQVQCGQNVACPHVVVSVEVNPIQACIARHMIDLAKFSQTAEVWVGQVRDIAPRLLEEFAIYGTGFIFLDYKGQIFHVDLMQMEHLQLFAHNAHSVADNVASPGAPLLLWQMSCSKVWTPTVWALHEFLEPDHEDWMITAILTQSPNMDKLQPPPAPLKELSWHTDHFRRRSEGFRPAETPVQNADRILFAHHVTASYKALGIEATPWFKVSIDNTF